MSLRLLAILLFCGRIVDTTDEVTLSDCSDGTCPTPAQSSDFECGLWLGPSPIKDAENHGFGLGMFTGRHITKGSTVESIYSSGGEVLIPLFTSLIHKTHPPLREYVWDDGNMPEIDTENSHGSSFLFIPGLAAIAPCTSQNNNLVFSDQSSIVDSGGVHRSKHPTAGSFSYRHNVRYTAVRDIIPGEELTVFCDDDDFDGGAYFLSTFPSSDDAVVCLDNLRIQSSTIPGIGQGLFSKQKIPKGNVITSTPLIPIHRKELDIVVGSKKPTHINNKQLLLNYCFGHRDSDLLLLPYGPMVNHMNHGQNPNAVIRWHTLAAENSKESRRQQFHHTELLELTADQVADTHGKGLVMDIVALRDIMPDEEILIDYGIDWSEAWRKHELLWPTMDAAYMSAAYISAAEHRARFGETFRTEEEQKSNPYPPNIRTICFYDKHIGKDESMQDYSTWDEDARNGCVRPCSIVGMQVSPSKGEVYEVQMTPADNDRVYEWCEINTITIVSGMPRSAIRLYDKPLTTDMFLPNAFRHEIGVPDGFFPEVWKKKKLRRTTKGESTDVSDESFKRKQSTREK